MDLGIFQQKLVSCIVCKSFSTTCRIFMKLDGVLNYHIGMCVLSGTCVWSKIEEMMLLDFGGGISANLGLVCCTQCSLNKLQDCNETQHSVRSRVCILSGIYVYSKFVLIFCQKSCSLSLQKINSDMNLVSTLVPKVQGSTRT